MEVHDSNGVVRWAEGKITVTDRLGPMQFARCSDWATMRDRLIRSVLVRVRGEPAFLCSFDPVGMQTACSRIKKNKLWSELPAVWSSPALRISVVTHHSLRPIEKATPIANLQAVPLKGEILQIPSIG